MGALAGGVILVYAAILIAGGFMGWRVSGSRISRTAGLASAALLAIAYRLSHLHPLAGYSMATAVSLALTVLFALRFRKTGKFFPAGLMSAISGVVFVFLGWFTVISQ